MAERVLVVDDNLSHRLILEEKLRHDGYVVEGVSSAEEALGRLAAMDPAVVVSDLRMPGLSGLDLLERMKASAPGIDLIMVTGHDDMDSVVGAMRGGAFDYLVKPVDLARLSDLVRRCLSEQALAREAESAGEEEGPPRGDLVGRDPRMIDIYKMIGVLCRNRATVLVRGETGTGKEMVARAIHDASAHADAPFIAVNCTALSQNLLESELFGHVKGAFTGADRSRKGYFELAGSGTIFLDEIGDAPPEFQSKLLRVLQDRQFFPVGGQELRTTEARVIAATHQPIEALVSEGRFREDLYFRLKVVEIRVPPLRERRGDIPVLARHLLERIREEVSGGAWLISDPAMRLLIGHDWPGNVRELENVLRRATILARGSTIGPEHVVLDAPGLGGPGSPTEEGGRGLSPSGDQTVDRIVADHVQKVLVQTGGNKSEASRILDISRSRLQRIVNKFKLDA